MDAGHRKRHTTTAAGMSAQARWPARTQRLLNVIGPLCAQWLEPALRQCLDRFDRALYQEAEHSHNHREQQRCFDSRALVEAQRTAFMETFAGHLRGGFANLGEEAEEPADARPTHQPLSLLEPGEHELTASLDKLAARGEAHHGRMLTELSYRLAVLVGAAPLEGAALPIGPAALVEALRGGLDTLETLPPEHRLLLLQNFEQGVILPAGTLYASVNAHLQDDGLLPQLRPYAAPRAAASARTVPANDAPAAAAAETTWNTGNTEAAGAPQTPITVLETLRDLLAQRRTGAGGAVAGQTATAEELQTALNALQQHLAQVTDNASRELRSAQRLREELLLQLNTGKPAGAAPTRLSAEQDDTVELVAMLFEQIGKQMHQGPHARSVLDELQLPMLRLAVTDRDFFDQGDHPARRLLGVVADAANNWLDGPDGEADQQLAARLSQLVDRARREPPSAGLYTTLLADIEHHLDQLNRRAKAAERRHVEAMQGRERLELARKRAIELLAARYAAAPPRGLLRALLDRAWADVLALAVLQHGEDSTVFAQRVRVTDQLLGRLPVDDADLLRCEVQAGLQQIGMHAEEAGQVALRLIGGEAAETTFPATPQSTPPATVPSTKPTLTRPAAAKPAPAAAPDHGATHTPATDRRPTAPPAPATATATPAFVAASPARTAASGSPHSATTPAPAAPLRTTPAPAAPPPDLLSATDLALRLKQRQRLGEGQHTKAASTADSEPPLGPQEARIHNRLRQLPFGSWFEFSDSVTGQTSQRKLAWFSPVTGNSLFVTRRGQRSEELNLRDLARAMSKGRVREMPVQGDGLLDRAWQALTGNLLRNATAKGARP